MPNNYKEKLIKKFKSSNRYPELLEDHQIDLNWIEKNLMDGIAKELFKENGESISFKKFEDWIESKLKSSNGNNNVPQDDRPPKSPESLKELILKVLRGNDDDRVEESKRERIREAVRNSRIEISSIEAHLTEEKALKFVKKTKQGNNKFMIVDFTDWLEDLKEKLKNNSTGNGNSSPSNSNQQNSNSQQQNQDNSQTSPLNENWENGVQSLISSQIDLNKFFLDLMNSWKERVEINRKAGLGIEGYDEGDKAAENEFLKSGELSSTILLAQIENLESELKDLVRKNAKKEAKEVIINKIENKYNLKLSEKEKKKVSLSADFLMRVVLENVLASDPLSQTEMQNSWERKILDLANSSFAGNTERKFIAEQIAYHFIFRQGFSPNSPVVEKKAHEVKESLSQCQVSPDLNEVKKIVSEIWKVLYVGTRTFAEKPYSISWEVPSEVIKVKGVVDEDDFDPSLHFPVFPLVLSDEWILSKITVKKVESWDKTKPTQTDQNSDESNTQNDKNSDAFDFSSTKEKVEKEKAAERQKEAEEVKNATNDLKNETLPEEERFSKLEEVEEKEGKRSYQENQTDIQDSKKDLFTKNSSGYRKTMGKVFRKKITDSGLTEAELTKIVEEWENNQSNDWEKIKESEKNINQKIGGAIAKKRVDEIGNQIKQVLKSGDKGEMIKILKELVALFNDTQDSVYLADYKNQTQAWMKDLENAISGSNNQTGNKGFFQPKVLIPVALGVVVLGVLTVMVIRSRRRKIK